MQARSALFDLYGDYLRSRGGRAPVAALVRLLRRRLQALIDRRFYRRKYDAARTLAAFSATLRTETDLAQLSEQFVAVVRETLQPTQVWLWLRPPARTSTPASAPVHPVKRVAPTTRSQQP